MEQITMFGEITKQSKRLTVQTKFGEREVDALIVVGQCALHDTLEGDGGYTVTHILSGKAIIHFTMLGYGAALRFLEKLQSVDIDDHYRRGGKGKTIQKEIKSLLYESLRYFK